MIPAKAGTEGKLFGSIGTADIAEAATKAGFKIERSEVRLPERPAAHGRRAHRSTCICTPTSMCRWRCRSSPKSKLGSTRWPVPPKRVAIPARMSLADAPVPPHSVEAEQAVLGGLLLDPAAWDNVADVVVAEDFYRPDHKLIFEAIAALCRRRQALRRRHRRRSSWSALGKLEQAGGLAYLGSLARDTPTAANVRAYAEIVRERSLLRQLIHAGTEIASAVFNNDGETARELVDKAEQRVFEIAEGGFRGKRRRVMPVRSLLPGVIDQIDEAYANPDKLRGLPTGFTDFDKMTGGLRPGDLVIVAGRPSMGKTTLAVNMAEYAALHPREKRASVAIFSMEMPSEQVITRMLSSIGGVPLQQPAQRHDLR